MTEWARQWAAVLAMSITLVLVTLAAVLIVRATNQPPTFPTSTTGAQP